MYHKIRSVIIAGLYPMIYFVCQVVIQIIVLQIVIYKYGKESSSFLMINQKMYLMTLWAAIICFLILLTINLVKKENIFKDYKKISFGQFVLYAISTVFLYIIIVIMNSLLIGFFPEYNNQIMDLFQMKQPIFAILVIGVVAPLIEELIFRGEVYAHLEKNFSKPMTVFLQAALFGLVHTIPLQRIQTFFMGLVFGYVRAKTENIWPSTIMHIISNTIACFLVFIVL